MTVSRVTGGHVLHLSGDIDGAVVDDLLAGHSLDGLDIIAVDVADLGYIDSAGLAFLVRWAQDSRRDGRPPEVRRTTRRFDRVLEIAGLTSVFVLP
jgi:anti-anti-sigma factor